MKFGRCSELAVSLVSYGYYNLSRHNYEMSLCEISFNNFSVSKLISHFQFYCSISDESHSITNVPKFKV